MQNLASKDARFTKKKDGIFQKDAIFKFKHTLLGKINFFSKRKQIDTQ